MMVSEVLKKHKNSIFIIGIISIIVLMLSFLHTFSTTTTSSAWNGAISSSFESGTGSLDNPYVINSAGEYAYFKYLLESDLASEYVDKHYVINNSFNYGNYDISINNTIPFSGSIDGYGNTISNASVNNSLFNCLDSAIIKNIGFININYYLNNETGGVFASNSLNSNFELIYLNAKIESKSNSFANFIYEDNASTINKVVIYNNYADEVKNSANFIYKTDSTSVSNTLIKDEEFEDFIINNNATSDIHYYQIVGDRIKLNDDTINSISSDLYTINADKKQFILKTNTPDIEISKKGIKRSPARENVAFTPVDSSKGDSIIYVNELDSDWNYYYSLNYASSPNGTLPTGENRNIYGESNLVRVMITYDGSDGEFTGLISKDERQSKMVYYKWVEVNNGKADITLIDNPFTNRPSGKGFNGWISDSVGVNVYLDRTLYQYHATFNVEKNGDKYVDVAIGFHAGWVDAQVMTVTNGWNSWNSVFNGFYSEGLHLLETTVRGERLPYDMSGYYVYKSVSRNTVFTGYEYRNRNYTYRSNYACARNTCNYYELVENENYDDGTTYYSWNGRSMSTVNANNLNFQYEMIYYYIDHDMAGYYVERTFSNGASIDGYYNSSGNMVSGTCRSNSCTYYEYLQGYDSDGNRNIYELDKNYYYLVTRDTNIAVIGANISGGFGNYSKPFTFTGLNDDTLSNYIWDTEESNINIYADTAIENIIIDSGVGYNNDDPTLSSGGWWSTDNSVLIANYNNLRVGRGIRRNGSNTNFDSFIGGTSSTGESGDDTKYRMVIESGFYSSGSMTLYQTSYGGDLYIQANAVYGNDIDKIDEENDNLVVNATAAGSWGGYIYSSRESALELTVKSGTFGLSKADMYTGIYVGGLSYGEHNAARYAKIEGGYIYNLIGGPLTASNRASKNDTYIYQVGGVVDAIVGGAGRSATYGNRIIAVSGGTVTYAVFGGSNGSGSDSSDGDGTVNGSSFIYIGGDATIGNDDVIASQNNTLWGAKSGNVFGNGNGKEGYSGIGSNDNSNIIIDGEATIKDSVYGGGNYGATGVSSTSSTTTTNIKILGGTVNNNVYGGGNQNGAGDNDTSATINITMDGGNVKGSIYGGSNVSGTINGVCNLNINNGTVDTNIYGGGKGNSTIVVGDTNVVIGSNIEKKPLINGSVYGGSAFGSVNGENATNASGKTNVTVNNGVVVNSVFGGGEGDSTYTPNVYGPIKVTINNGDITNVFGGNDQAGSHTLLNEVYLNGGTITNVYGGGNKSSVSDTHVYEQGSTVTNIYGGSNTLGDVSTTTVNISSGTTTNVYGGNNEGGTCTTTNVLVEGTANITSSVYGGGNQVDTTTTNVTLTSANGTIPNVFGGGNSASVTQSNITQNGVNATNIFGGSNSSGIVSESHITYNAGTTTNVYGGNNEGGNTLTSNINFVNGTATTIYGGGNKANGNTSNIDVRGGTITDIFGGGNSAGVTTSNVHLINGNVTNIYGGSNNTGLVTNANVVVDNTSSAVNSVFGGGNKAEVDTPSIIINNGTINNVYGGGNLARVLSNTTVDINGGQINTNVYGGGNFGIVNGNSNVTITNARVLGSAYAGGNGASATLLGDTNITIDGNTIIGSTTSTSPTSGCVFGGGNQAYTGVESESSSTSTVNIVGGTIYGNVYGGANTSVIYGNTDVNIGNSAYNDTLTRSDIYIKGHVFGGGEANAEGSENYDWYFISVTLGTNINVDGTNYNDLTIDGSFYGGGNASSASGDSYLDIINYGSKNNPKKNISIQRVKYVSIDNSSILLKGAIDRANDYDKELFSISRVEDLKLKNNSELYFETGANLLEKFESLDSNGNIASVTIDEDNNTVSKNVDNRIYMYEGKNLNIAKDQQVTDYGNVVGMTFLGIFNYDGNDNVNTGIYNSSYEAGDTLSWSGTFSRGSYVLGAHEVNHDIKVNGFYSNFINEDTTINEVKYIVPTPSDAKFYMWFIGENVMEYNVNLVASKYSTLGSVEKSFLEFSKPNTSFQILSFESSEIAEGVSLVDKNDIPRIAASDADANNIFGLSMESSNSGWLTNGSTSFYTSEPSIGGVQYYEGENSTAVPTMLFYLYHSKNITEEKDLGTVRISVMAITKINALSNEIKRLVINVSMSSALFQTNEYEGAMTPGDKYELFASTATNITTKSKLSAYYALYGSNTNLYKEGYHRALSSSYVLPVGTKITMLDFVQGEPEYYYHVIDENDYNNTLAEFQREHECSYLLSMFTKMGSKSNDSNYNDAIMNNTYYDGVDSSEEFVFIIDFSDTEITTDQIGNTLLMEIRDRNEESIITVLGIQHSQLTYNLYANNDSVIDVNATPSDNPLYIGYNDIFDVSINYSSSTLNGVTITDTQYFDSKLGIQIYIKNNEGNVVSGTDLTGTYFLMDGVKYYPDIDGYTHIKLSDKVGNTQKWITFNTEKSSLATGDYTFVIEAFASPDGIYYSRANPVTKNIDMTIISSIYGLNPIIDDNSVVLSSNNDKNINVNIKYTSLLDNPNIRLAMYRRKYDEVYDTDYELVDLADYVTQGLTITNNEFEYLLVSNPANENQITLLLRNELLTGTYRLAFRLYDNDTMIGEIIRYIIVR